ncbi:hypothetical protein H0H92_006208 [Tricholoma furcatifolium]|nr:hypothetical protein H0H92_006208 [Tricholoma furcatifolium]
MSIQNKHFLNTPESLVLDSLRGLCAVNPELILDEKNKTAPAVYLGSHDRSKVALLCGGGSGHEPAHAGFVGKGLLTGAVCGSVFASPSASQMKARNYTGDVLNFGLAKEQYAALHQNKAESVKFVIVGDDVAVGKTQGSIVGRRGLAGTVLVYKIAGALAERGESLEEVYNIAQWVASNVATIGVGLDHCHATAATSHLQTSEIEIGMGIHNESGNRRLSPNPPLKDLISHLLDLLTSTSDPERSFLPFSGEKGKDEVVLLVNNLGGVSELELGAIAGEVNNALHTRGVVINRILSGTFMASDVSNLFAKLREDNKTDNSSAPPKSLLLSLLDDQPNAPGWRWSSHVAPPVYPQVALVPAQGVQLASGHTLRSEDSSFEARVKRACEALITAEPEITKMDTIAGDGDCGLTLKLTLTYFLQAGAEGVLTKLSEDKISGNNLDASMIAVAQVAEEAMGGTSGALYSIFFSALAQGLHSTTSSSTSVTPEAWSQALTYALNKLYTYTRARPPSRTLVDPLAAFIETLAQSSGNDTRAAVVAAASAAEKTRDMEAKAGRSAYVEGDRLKKEKIPDPGAWGVKTILESLFN